MSMCKKIMVLANSYIIFRKVGQIHIELNYPTTRPIAAVKIILIWTSSRSTRHIQHQGRGSKYSVTPRPAG